MRKSLLRTAEPFCHFCHFCGTLLSHAESFYCPAVIGFAASLVEVIGFAASLVEEIKDKWKSSFNGKTAEQPPYSAKSLYTLTV